MEEDLLLLISQLNEELRIVRMSEKGSREDFKAQYYFKGQARQLVDIIKRIDSLYEATVKRRRHDEA